MARTHALPLSSMSTFVVLVFLISTTSNGCQARSLQDETFMANSSSNSNPTFHNKAVPAGTVQAVLNTISKLESEWNDQVVDKDTITCKIVDHFRSAFRDYNCMVVHSKHLASFEDSVNEKITVPTSRFSDTTFDIYVFKRGLFTLLGDGGFINWCFDGNYQRDGAKVNFSDP